MLTEQTVCKYMRNDKQRHVNRQVSTPGCWFLGAHSRVIRGTSGHAIIDEWSFLIWPGFCQRSKCVTSVTLSSFLGVSEGEGIATGNANTHAHVHERTQNPTLYVDFQQGQHMFLWGFHWFEFLVFRDPNKGQLYFCESTLHCRAVSWDPIYKRPGQMLHLWTRMSRVDQSCSLPCALDFS